MIRQGGAGWQEDAVVDAQIRRYQSINHGGERS